jgi:hypothetical protein
VRIILENHADHFRKSCGSFWKIVRIILQKPLGVFGGGAGLPRFCFVPAIGLRFPGRCSRGRRTRELEAALADAHMDYCLEGVFLDIACERLGTSTEEML